MTRRPKTNRVPRTRAGDTWTEAAFWGFLRSGLRRMSKRWPPIASGVLVENRRKSKSDNKRLKWEYQCCVCRKWFPRKEVQVEHTIPCGSLKSFDDLPGFVERLFCEVEGLTIQCKSCHKKKTEEERRKNGR